MIEIINDPIKIQSLSNIWNELAEQSKSPLLRSEWFSGCAEACCQSTTLQLITNHSEGAVNAIAPLVLVKKRGFKILELLGTSFLYEPSGLLYKDEEALEELINAMIKIGKPVVLSRIRSDSPEISMLRRINKSCYCVLNDSMPTPFLPITATWPEFEAAMSSRDRYTLRRARKKANSFGKVHLEIASPGPETLMPCLEEFCRVEAAGWKGREGTAIIQDERMKRFIFSYAMAASRIGKLRLCSLRINNVAAASLLAVEYFDSFWVLKIGFDEAFARCSPGILLMHETIHHAFQNRLETYEFLGADAPWIHMWTEQMHPYMTATIYPFSFGGQLGLSMDAGYALVGRTLKLARK